MQDPAWWVPAVHEGWRRFLRVCYKPVWSFFLSRTSNRTLEKKQWETHSSGQLSDQRCCCITSHHALPDRPKAFAADQEIVLVVYEDSFIAFPLFTCLCTTRKRPGWHTFARIWRRACPFDHLAEAFRDHAQGLQYAHASIQSLWYPAKRQSLDLLFSGVGTNQRGSHLLLGKREIIFYSENIT